MSADQLLRDWTFTEPPGVIRWSDWADRLIEALSGDDEDKQRAASKVLRRFTGELDRLYDDGFDHLGIAPDHAFCLRIG